MSTTEFTGHVAAMRADSEFYGAEDFVGRGDVPAQITRCNRCLARKACGVSQKEMFTLTLHIDGKLADKELWLKPTNRKQLVRMYGPNVSDWKAKWIWLFVEEVRSPQGGMTLGIRIRDKKDAPPNGKPATQKAADKPAEQPIQDNASRFKTMKDEWKVAQKAIGGHLTEAAFREFVDTTTGGMVPAAKALEPANYTAGHLAACEAAVKAMMPADHGENF